MSLINRLILRFITSGKISVSKFTSINLGFWNLRDTYKSLNTWVHDYKFFILQFVHFIIIWFILDLSYKNNFNSYFQLVFKFSQRKIDFLKYDVLIYEMKLKEKDSTKKNIFL